MSDNYIEYKDRVAFHPGYYVQEMVDESGLTQEEFARRLGTTPKNLCVLLKGNQSLSIDMASKLSRMLGTTVAYWLKLQQAYDELRAEFISDQELQSEREVFKLMDYSYFRDNFHLPDLPRQVDQQIKAVREFLSVASLALLEERNMACSFRSYTENLSLSNIVNANAMVQIGVNAALKTEAPHFNKHLFETATEFALSQTENHSEFLPEIRKSFLDAGVVLVVLPNLKNSGINGATRKVGSKLLLMVNDRRHYADTFWFTLFHEIGHIMNGDYGVTFSGNKNESESEADIYAQKMLIPEEAYTAFLSETDDFTEQSIREFSKQIKRDPGIVFGRLQKDGKISYTETALGNRLRHKYRVFINI
ncbi:MAG: HigA family addiction module antitoxin [Lachnospiraceae bacterium]|nr:HigA family addiction module antitoxin [Lachnospiraceae bacterium]